LGIGEDGCRNGAIVGDVVQARNVGCGDRAWYFPTCVSSATPVGSPIAAAMNQPRCFEGNVGRDRGTTSATTRAKTMKARAEVARPIS